MLEVTFRWSYIAGKRHLSQRRRKVSSMNRAQIMRRFISPVLGFAVAIAFSATLTGAALAPERVPSPTEAAAQACWTEYESGQHACAASSDELANVVLQKYNKVMVESVEQFESIQKSGSFRSMAVPASALATYAIGTLWTGANYSGNADYYTTSNASTCYGQTYTFASPSVVWNDQTSSFAGQGACQIRLYDDINYYGGFYGYFDCRSNLANVGYNDRASSVRFHLTNTYSCF